MIFKISTQFIESVREEQLSDICCEMICKRQYISCDSTVWESIKKAIKRHGSTSQKDLLSQYKGFDIPQEIQKYFTTIDVDLLPYSALEKMLTQPSRLLIENSCNEWGVYKNIMGTYKHDRKYKNLFTALEQAKKENRISSLHGGGYTTFVGLIRENEKGDYANVFKYKVCIIFDRDTDDASSYDVRKNGLFNFLCSKSSTEITDNDIYSLNQNGYIWHMWYKRTVENYFPNKCFQRLGMNTTVIPTNQSERDFYNFGNAPGYNKNQLSLLPQGMERMDYETGLKKFVVNGESMTELQLLLLKFIKII